MHGVPAWGSAHSLLFPAYFPTAFPQKSIEIQTGLICNGNSRYNPSRPTPEGTSISIPSVQKTHKSTQPPAKPGGTHHTPIPLPDITVRTYIRRRYLTF